MDIEKMLTLVEERLSRCRILVTGDVMLDKYYYGEVTRISPEAPVPINHIMRQKETLGGAANVAHNLALLGCDTLLAGFVGEDYHCRSLKEKLVENGIDHAGLVPTNRPTTTKMRIIGGHQQMMRLDFESTEPLEKIYIDKFLAFVRCKLAESIDAIIVSDYAKGTCSEVTTTAIIEAAHDLGATELQTLVKVVVPSLLPGILSGFLIAITMSLEDFVITFFVSGPGSTTLPLYVYSMIRFGVSPVINSLSCVMIIATCLIAFALRKGLKTVAASH